ncbi:sodium:proton antiporter [Altererythrobacter arenosus]|uniref:Sodium:proton antiporter n=1 Tax=Altererythrobacter arenosus TaxID=3032592 RepID=A0ABY8G1C5_9SPHN|nr:sodium:proton antiporter [Altererythrobacter sp. CAU 1644]WFL78274.1 sodium:proton antiporter [Altererythrobacter sp. CAU 1644]
MNYFVLAGLLLVVLVFAALSKRAEMSVVTMPIIFTGLGWLTYLLGAELIGRGDGRGVLHLFAEVTLILVLFADATRVRIGELLGNAGIPARMLLIGMPLTIALGTLLAMWVSPDQPWALGLLVAAILTPTDAALGQAVVSDKAIPQRLRQGVLVESGLNDGLALPVVIIAALAAVGQAGGMDGESASSLVGFGLKQVVLGPIAGIVVGWSAAWLLDLAVRRGFATEAYQGIYFLAAAFLCFVGAEAIGGNGLIAAFVGGLVFGNRLSCSSHFVSEFMETEGQLFTMATFFVFGAVLAPFGWEHAGWRTLVLAIGFLTFVRVVPIVLSLSGTGLRLLEKFFLGWFGPRGLASILFALLVLESYAIPGADELLACVTLTVLLSILLHGTSAHPVAARFAEACETSASATAMGDEAAERA